jgi:antirestriction protein ArdC
MEEEEIRPLRPRHTIFRQVYESILKDLKKGVLPWCKPWESKEEGEVCYIPINAVSRRPYRGINVLILWIQRNNKGYKSNLWLTKLQAEKMGLNININQDPTPIIYYNNNTIKYYYLFNIEQINDYPKDIFKWHPIAKPEYIVKNCGIKIEYEGEIACYNSLSDIITLPRKRKFVNAEGYYSTVFHEIVHWSGYEDRLNRLEKNSKNVAGRWFEEIIAEIGSAFVCAETGIINHLQHANYIGYYFGLLNKDWKILLKACNRAQDAADYIIDNALGRVGVVDCYRTGHVKDIRKLLNRALGQYARYNNKVKVGITADPDRRWGEAKFEDDNWKKMIILYKTGSRKYALEGKKYILGYLINSSWKELQEFPINIGNISSNATNYHVYALMK